MVGLVILDLPYILTANLEHCVSADILSHTLSNGLVLIGEPRRGSWLLAPGPSEGPQVPGR